MKDTAQLRDRSADCPNFCLEDVDFPKPTPRVLRILIVEDNRLIRGMLERFLASKGFRIITANDGQEGLTAALQENPDVIISDIEMPVLSGEEMVAQLRTLSPNKEIPVIFFSGYPDKDNRSVQIGDGIIYLSKACQVSEVLSAIWICLS